VRVFLDTNVLVSGLTTRGLCSDVLELAVAEHELLTAEVVLTELNRILSRKFKIPQPRVDTFIRYLSQFHVEPLPRDLPSIAVHDPADVLVLASALDARADILVTGDKDLLEVPEAASPIPIMAPRAFWLRYRPSPS
jgi:putative PIN family toxin of toxin-antitoxin system